VNATGIHRTAQKTPPKNIINFFFFVISARLAQKICENRFTKFGKDVANPIMAFEAPIDKARREMKGLITFSAND
jgi:hypothetical protein